MLTVVVALAGSPREAHAAPKTIEEANTQILADAMQRFDLVPGTFVKTPPDCTATHPATLARKKLRARWDRMLADFPADAALYGLIVDAQDALVLDGIRVALHTCFATLDAKTEASIADIEAVAHRVLGQPDFDNNHANARQILEKIVLIRASSLKAIEDYRRQWREQNDPTMIAAYVRAYVARASFPPGKAALVGLVRARLAFYEASLGSTEMKALSEKVKGFKYTKKMFALP